MKQKSCLNDYGDIMLTKTLMAQCLPSFLLSSWLQRRQDEEVISSDLFQRIAVAARLNHIFIGKGWIWRSDDPIQEISRSWNDRQILPLLLLLMDCKSQRLIIFWIPKYWCMWSSYFQSWFNIDWQFVHNFTGWLRSKFYYKLLYS